MRKLLGLLFASALLSSPAMADWTGKNAAGTTITFKNAVDCTSVVCVPQAAMTDSTGVNFVAVKAGNTATVSDIAHVVADPNVLSALTTGSNTDAPCTLPASTTACSLNALAKATANAASGPLAAQSNHTTNVGQVSIDQSTPGSTNAVAPNTPVGTAAFAATQVSVAATATSILAARTGAPGTGRASATITNTTTTAIFIGGSGVTTSTGTLLPGIVGASITINTTAAIFGIVATGTATVTALESF